MRAPKKYYYAQCVGSVTSVLKICNKLTRSASFQFRRSAVTLFISLRLELADLENVVKECNTRTDCNTPNACHTEYSGATKLPFKPTNAVWES